MNVAISDNKYKPQPPTTEQYHKMVKKKKEIYALPITIEEADAMYDEYLKEHRL